jgi:glutathione S-transferase
MSKPIHLYSHATGPNPWKVVIFLEELGIPYETEFVDFANIKKEPFINVNPNGRVPAITDPNTNVTLWEVRCRLAPSPASRRLTIAVWRHH